MMTIITNLTLRKREREEKFVIKEFAFEHHDDRYLGINEPWQNKNDWDSSVAGVLIT